MPKEPVNIKICYFTSLYRVNYFLTILIYDDNNGYIEGDK